MPLWNIAIVSGIHRKPSTKRVVFITGTAADATNVATYVFLRDIRRNSKPPANQATVVFTRQISVVTSGL